MPRYVIRGRAPRAPNRTAPPVASNGPARLAKGIPIRPMLPWAERTDLLDEVEQEFRDAQRLGRLGRA